MVSLVSSLDCQHGQLSSRHALSESSVFLRPVSPSPSPSLSPHRSTFSLAVASPHNQPPPSVRGIRVSLQIQSLLDQCGSASSLDQDVVVGGRNQIADAVEDILREVGEAVQGPRDAWGDSGHVPQEVQGGIHHNRGDTRDRSTAEAGRKCCVASVADLEVISYQRDPSHAPSDETADGAVLNERMKETAPLVHGLTRQLLMVVKRACWILKSEILLCPFSLA